MEVSLRLFFFTSPVHIFETTWGNWTRKSNTRPVKYEIWNAQLVYQKEDWKIIWRQCGRKDKISNSRGFCKIHCIVMYQNIQVKNRQIQVTMESNGFSIFMYKIYRVCKNILLLHGKQHLGREVSTLCYGGEGGETWSSHSPLQSYNFWDW